MLPGRGKAFGWPDVFVIGATALSFNVMTMAFAGVTEIQISFGVFRTIDPAGPPIVGRSLTFTRSLSTIGGSPAVCANIAVSSARTFSMGLV